MPCVLGEFKKRYPDIELIVTTGTTESMIHDMNSQSLDLDIVVEVHRPITTLQMTSLRPEELVVIVSSLASRS